MRPIAEINPESELQQLLDTKFGLAERGDYYALIGVSMTADQEAIDQAWSGLVRLLNDRRLAEDDMVARRDRVRKVLVRAYAVLSNPTRRAVYHRKLQKKESERKTERVLLADDGDLGLSKADTAELLFASACRRLTAGDYREAERLLARAADAQPERVKYRLKLAETVRANRYTRSDDDRLALVRRHLETACSAAPYAPSVRIVVGFIEREEPHHGE